MAGWNASGSGAMASPSISSYERLDSYEYERAKRENMMLKQALEDRKQINYYTPQTYNPNIGTAIHMGTPEIKVETNKTILLCQKK